MKMKCQQRQKKFIYQDINQHTKPNYLQIQKAIQAITLAKKPLVLAGAGVLFADAREELTEFVEKYKLPVVNTLLGLGSIHGEHELVLRNGRYARVRDSK